jgi:hypothetical protein
MLVSMVLFGGSLFDSIRNLPPGVLGEKYTAALKFGPAGGCSTVGVNWQVAAGSLPRGMRLVEGKLEGVPDRTGIWELAMRASSACSDVILPLRIAVTDRVIQDDLISVHSRSRSR